MIPNRDRIQLWVDTLLSGQFRQTQGCLRDKDGYCCLGVAMEVASENDGPSTNWEREGSTYAHLYFDYSDEDSEESVLPVDFYEWFGLESEDPVLLKVLVPNFEVEPGVRIADIPYSERELRSKYIGKAAMSKFDEERVLLVYSASALNDDGVPFSIIASLIRQSYLSA